MDTARIFWASLAWFGLTQAANWGLAVVRVGVWPGNAAAVVAALVVTAVGTFGLTSPRRAGGPDERNAAFYAALGGAVVGTVALLV